MNANKLKAKQVFNDLLKEVSKITNVKKEDIISKTRAERIYRARACFCYLSVEISGLPINSLNLERYTSIDRTVFGYAYSKISSLIYLNDKFGQCFEEIETLNKINITKFKEKFDMLNKETIYTDMYGERVIQYSFDEINNLILQWADKRGILNAEIYEGQLTKFHEEYGEMYSSVLKSNYQEIVDGVGDSLVVKIIIDKITSDNSSQNLNANYMKCFYWPSTYNIEALMDSFKSPLAPTGYDALQCLNYAYHSIKDRTGQMVCNDGVWSFQKDNL